VAVEPANLSSFKYSLESIGAKSNLRAKRAKKLGCCTQNCRILCYAFLGNLPPKIFPLSSFQFFTFPPTFSKRHLPSPVNGVDVPACDVDATCMVGLNHYLKLGLTAVRESDGDIVFSIFAIFLFLFSVYTIIHQPLHS